MNDLAPPAPVKRLPDASEGDAGLYSPHPLTQFLLAGPESLWQGPSLKPGRRYRETPIVLKPIVFQNVIQGPLCLKVSRGLLNPFIAGHHPRSTESESLGVVSRDLRFWQY